jgi:hypothetical protein
MQAHEVDRYCDGVWESRERHRIVKCHTWIHLHLKGLNVTSSKKTPTMITCTESPFFVKHFALLWIVPLLWIHPKMELWLSEHNYIPEEESQKIITKISSTSTSKTITLS